MSAPFYREDDDQEAVFVLERVQESESVEERFKLLERFRYVSARTSQSFIVPADDRFRTDLASVPSFLTWLVPKGGTHTPAALLHDALIPGEEEPQSYIGPPVTRREADALFRDALGELGVPVIRRWLMFAGVSLPTIADRGKLRWAAIAVFVLLLTVLVAAQTLDMFDTEWFKLPWMGDKPLALEVLIAFAAAIGLTLVLLPLWWGWWRVGLAIGWLLAFGAVPLLFVLVCLAAYWVLENLVSKPVEGRGPSVAANRTGA
ncbi:MAG: DUF1353 domain-containing protein [Gaiellaceae bacterium]